ARQAAAEGSQPTPGAHNPRNQACGKSGLRTSVRRAHRWRSSAIATPAYEAQVAQTAPTATTRAQAGERVKRLALAPIATKGTLNIRVRGRNPSSAKASASGSWPRMQVRPTT